MAERDSKLTSRRLATIVAVLFGAFVLFDLGLFGVLILESLSQRELEKILLDTREEVEPLARQLVKEAEKLGQTDLFVVVSVAEIPEYVGSVLLERDIIRSVKIRTREGTVVFETEKPVGIDAGDGGDGDFPLVEGGSSSELKLQGELESEVPIGELGTLVIGISEPEIQRRVGVLRRELVRQASLIGAFTVVLLGVAVVLLRALFKRADRFEKQAAEAERMAMIGTLASGLAHEIRNPLNSLSLNMQMLEEEAREPGGGSGGTSGHRLLAITRSEIHRLEKLATDFLSYAKPRPLEREDVAVAELFAHVSTVLAGEVRAQGAELCIRDETSGARVRVDRDQMSQLLLNLTRNALAATAEVDRKGVVEWRVYRRDERTVLEVRDNGAGIAATERTKVFDLFYSTRKGGTGLGLAIVERIAHSHGAEIELDSSPSGGTTVRLLLPGLRG